MIARALALMLAVAAPAAATAQGAPCDAAPALGLDVSSSIDDDEAQFQRRDLAAGFRDLGAIRRKPLRVLQAPVASR